MEKTRYKPLILVFLVVFTLCLFGCGSTDSEVTETTEPYNPNLDVLEYTLAAVSSSDLEILEQYPNLTSVNLRGSNCYAAIMDYIAANPKISVQYDVQIGEMRYDHDTMELDLTADSYDFHQLLDNLMYLPNVTSLHLPQTTLTSTQLSELRETYPEIKLDYTVMVLDNELSGDINELDLSFLSSENTDQILDALSKLTSLQDIYLMNEDGKSDLSPSDVKKIMVAIPGATVHYTFELYGKMISTTDETVEYVSKYMGNDAVPKIREALDILPNCTYFKLDNCSISNELMAEIRDDYPAVKIVWRVFYGGKYSSLTDTNVIRCVEELTDGNSKNLKYCTDVEYMDIGHCYYLSDLSFVSYMPKLKVAILSDCYTATLEPFTGLQNLQWIEIVNCNRIKDLTPLSTCTNLKGLNMSYVFSIEDLSPLYGLQNLERLFMGRNDFDQETIDAVREALPNCWVTDHAENVAWIGFNYSVGWRLDDENTFADWYLEIKEIFGYTRGI